MGLYDEVVEVPRRTMVLFFLIDTSGSMKGSKIGAVNAAIEEVMPDIRSISASNAEACIKIASMTFSDRATWIDAAPVEAEKYRWNYLNASGRTSMGDACLRLNEKLSTKAFMSDATGSYAPVIFLMSDGEPTDNFEDALAILQRNPWFRKAIKVAIAIGQEANKVALEQFTSDRDAVITVYTPDALRKWIQFLSVRASEIGSQSIGVGDGVNAPQSKQQQFVMDVKELSGDWDDWDASAGW